MSVSPRRVFVTGATGVLGRRVVPALVEAGHEVAAVARSADKAGGLRAAGATPVDVDLFDVDAVRRAVDGFDAVAHLATNIPTGASAATRRGWRVNDRLRTEAAGHLTSAAEDGLVGRLIQESITFPYEDGGDEWLDEWAPRTYFWGNESSAAAEVAVARVAEAGGAGVVLRFAQFMASDSAHMKTFVSMARRGLWGLFGADDAFIPFVDVADAATAVVAALDVPAGVYNVAEAEPLRRRDHRAALARVVGRDRLRDLPGLVSRIGGPAVDSMSRSQRVSSKRLTDATSWAPTGCPLEMWERVA